MFEITFAVSGVTTNVFLPSLVTFVLAFFGAMAGVTGAFLLLPFQISVLGYSAPGVSATNFTYNIFAIPGTIYRYAREGRLNWPLAGVISIGSLPGIFFGYWARVTWLTDPRYFKPFAGLVLLYLAWLVGKSIWGEKKKIDVKDIPTPTARILSREVGVSKITYEFDEREYSFDPRKLAAVAMAVGMVGGAYGIGGGAVLAPFCISVLRLPVHSVAGASLFGTFVCSIVGVAVYQFGLFSGGMETGADYLLGAMFGLGGILGGYLGARAQKHIPQRPIKIGLFAVLIVVALKYLLAVFQG